MATSLALVPGINRQRILQPVLQGRVMADKPIQVSCAVVTRNRVDNLERCLAKHAAGKGAKYTRGRGPFRLVYSETCAGRAEATRREAAIKLMDKAKKRLLFS